MVHDIYHTPVLKQEVLDYLLVTNNKRFIDATLGGAGHTSALLELGASVLGIDVDDDALSFVEQLTVHNSQFTNKLKVVKGNFRDIDRIAEENGFEDVDGILFDLGVSSHQLDTPQRGFSIQHTGPLDMRMDNTLSIKAKDLINGLTRQELVDLFTRFGEEGFARHISNAISEARHIKPIETTEELAKIIEKVVYGKGEIHPATRVFQALRIVVNDELNSLEEALPKSINLLKKNGRVVVISFHSLEDRIVKNKFLEFEEKGLGKILTKKPLIPTELEQEKNRRSRSSKMRVFEKN